jgi:hypothetical protein
MSSGVLRRVVLAVAALGWLASGVSAADGKGKTGASPSPSPSPAASPQATSGLKLTLKWSTASEVDNYGFFVHRGDSQDGPFTPRNEKIIPGAGNKDTPSRYVWEDHDVERGKTYYYYLESVSIQGVKEKFSPVTSKTCCEPPAEPPASPSPKP